MRRITAFSSGDTDDVGATPEVFFGPEIELSDQVLCQWWEFEHRSRPRHATMIAMNSPAWKSHWHKHPGVRTGDQLSVENEPPTGCGT